MSETKFVGNVVGTTMLPDVYVQYDGDKSSSGHGVNRTLPKVDGLRVGDRIEVTVRVLRRPMSEEDAVAWQAASGVDVDYYPQKKKWFASTNMSPRVESDYTDSPLSALNSLRDKLEGR